MCSQILFGGLSTHFVWEGLDAVSSFMNSYKRLLSLHNVYFYTFQPVGVLFLVIDFTFLLRAI